MNVIIDKAVQFLANDGIIGFPTDTVYGIGCDAYSYKAIDRIYKLKNRLSSKPLILFIKDKAELSEYIKEIPDAGQRLINKFWPGKLTIIFKSNCRDFAFSGVSTIGIRIPNYEPILTILKNYENPLATTSANLEGTPPPMSNLEMNIKPDFIIPGKCDSGVQSTIIDITSYPPQLLREGEIKESELEAVIGCQILNNQQKTKSPISKII